MGESIDEIRLNNAHLENELNEARAQLGDAERELDLRLDTLQMIRSVAMPGPMAAGSDSMEDTALIEAVQAHASSSEELAKAQAELGQARSQAQVWRQRSEARVACYGFEEGDLALFLKDGDIAGCWEAFHQGCPHHYLELGDMAGDLEDESQILGRITGKVLKVAGEGVGGDPFGLGGGVEYYLVTIQPTAS